MEQRTHHLKDDVSRGLEQLETLRDDVRLRIHLASMDVQDEWAKLEEELRELQSAARSAGRISAEAVSDLARRLRGVRDVLMLPAPLSSPFRARP